MKIFSSFAAALIGSSLAFLSPSPVMNAGENHFEIPMGSVRLYPDVAQPYVVVLSVSGRASFSPDGDHFKGLKTGDLLHEGASVRTEKATVDLFLRRFGTTIRILPGSELKIEKLAKSGSLGTPAMEGSLDLRKGRIFCFVRSAIPGNKFEVRHGGKSIFDGEHGTGYDIGANDVALGGKSSFSPLPVVSDVGVLVMAPGEKVEDKAKTTMRLPASDRELTLLQLDELRALAEVLSPEEEAALQNTGTFASTGEEKRE